MVDFLDNNFLLSTATSELLYHEIASRLPLIDYHNHLPPRDIADRRVFDNLSEAWLEDDHYKWRALRWVGVEEVLITGDADPWDKFVAWAEVVPLTLRNPLYTWTHLELRRCFGIDLLLSEDTAREVWDEANRQLAKMPCTDFLSRFRVEVAGTTDDPIDTLDHHTRISRSDLSTRVVPTFRPDKCYNLQRDATRWNVWVAQLGRVADVDIRSLDDLLEALSRRHRAFADRGARASDHSLPFLPDLAADERQARKAVDRLLAGETPDDSETRDALTLVLLRHVASLNHAAGWAMQLHLGPLRNANQRLFQERGPDAGGDSIGDWRQGPGLQRLLDGLNQEGRLPRTILYNVNPADHAVMATMCGNFQGGGLRGRVQWGSAWWYLDQEDGMRRQIEDLSNMGLLSTFLGMVTDSRSFLSFPRHEVFRRILCDILGTDAETGRLPQDTDLLGKLVHRVCFLNAQNYFDFPLKRKE